MVSAEQATLLVAGATLFGAFIGSITQVVLDIINAKRERKSLRLSLKSELKSIPNLDDSTWLALGYQDDTETLIPSVVYQSNNGKIGQLTPKEAEAVSDFYSLLLAYKSLAEQSSGLDETDDLEESMEDLLGTLETGRKKAIAQLEKNL